MRYTKRAKNTVSRAENRATMGSPTAHARVLGIRKDAARGRSITTQSSLRAAVEEHHLETSGPGWSAIERNVYETIARSFIGGREGGHIPAVIQC